MRDIICLTHNHLTHKGVTFEERLVTNPDGARVFLGVAKGVEDEALLEYFAKHTSFVVLPCEEDVVDNAPPAVDIDPETPADPAVIAPGAAVESEGGESVPEDTVTPENGAQNESSTVSLVDDTPPADPEVPQTPQVPVPVPFPAELLTLATSKLEEEVAKITNIESLEQLVLNDERKTARAMYRQRIRALQEGATT